MVLKRRNHVQRMLVYIRYPTAVYCIKVRTCFHMIVISLNFFLFLFFVCFHCNILSFERQYNNHDKNVNGDIIYFL